MKTKVYTTQFWLLCLSSLLFFGSFNMIIPDLPNYLTGLGGAEFKGLIISLFTLTAMASRPFSGKIADTVGRIPVMIIGTSVCVVVSLLYPILSSVSGFLMLRLIHGFSTGFTPTGLTAYLADIIPVQKRGEAMGILGTAGTVGMSAGLSVGPEISSAFSLDALFFCSSAVALISIGLLFGVKETLKNKQKLSIRVLKIHKRELFEPRVLITCVVMLLTCYAYGTVFTVIPDLCAHVGMPSDDKGLPFTFLTVASLSVRLIAGKASDRFGRRSVVLVSTALGAISMAVIGFGSEPRDILIGISLYGLAQGMTSPTLFAWATDLSDERFKGRGISSLYIFMEMGIGVGAFASGFIYGNDSNNFFITFMTASFMATFAFLYLIFTKYTGRPRLVKTEVVTDIEQIP